MQKIDLHNKTVFITGSAGFIGSNLVQLSTGIDFVKAVIDISLGEEPDLELGDHAAAGVRFVFDQKETYLILIEEMMDYR